MTFVVDKERLTDAEYVERLKIELQPFYLVGLNSKSELTTDKLCLFVKSYIQNERLCVDIIDISSSNKAVYITYILGTGMNYKLYG